MKASIDKYALHSAVISFSNPLLPLKTWHSRGCVARNLYFCKKKETNNHLHPACV